MVGDSGVGKSSILMQYTSGTFNEEQSATIGVDFKVKIVDLDGKKLKLTISDTAGQERFRTLTSTYYRSAQGVVLAYDVTRRETFDNVKVWLEEVDNYSTSEDIVKLLVGNKVDLEANRQVSKEDGLEFARQHNMLFIETSAKTKIGVQRAFEELCHKILDTPSLCSPAHGAGGSAKGADTVS